MLWFYFQELIDVEAKNESRTWVLSEGQEIKKEYTRISELEVELKKTKYDDFSLIKKSLAYANIEQSLYFNVVCKIYNSMKENKAETLSQEELNNILKE